MDDLSPDAIIGIAAGVVAGVAGLGVGVFWYACPRSFAIYFGRPRPPPAPRPKLTLKPDVLQISQNPLVVYPRPHAAALPREVDIDSVLKIRRLKQEFKAAPLRK